MSFIDDLLRFSVTSPKEPKLLKEGIHNGLQYRIIQGPFSINGYVAVSKTHLYYGKHYNDVNVEVHGGLTFNQQGDDNDDLYPDSTLWWFGFDTAHGFSGIWSMEDVESETKRLAEQLVLTY